MINQIEKALGLLSDDFNHNNVAECKKVLKRLSITIAEYGAINIKDIKELMGEYKRLIDENKKLRQGIKEANAMLDELCLHPAICYLDAIGVNMTELKSALVKIISGNENKTS